MGAGEEIVQSVAYIRIVYETTRRNTPATKRYIESVHVDALKNLKNATAATAVFNEDDVMVGYKVEGNPSKEMRKRMDEEFGPDEEEVSGL